MKYIINSIVIFDTNQYILTLIDNTHTSIKLSNSSGRVLEELIKHKDTQEPVSREHLFSAVWKSHGLEPSNGNLNQQVSLIRKKLYTLGLKISSIITVPKRGFKMNDKLIINHSKNNIFNTYHKLFNKNYLRNKLYLISNIMFIKLNIKNSIAILIMFFTIIGISAVYIHIRDQNNQKLYFCKQINSSGICTLHPIPGLECKEYNLYIADIT